MKKMKEYTVPILGIVITLGLIGAFFALSISVYGRIDLVQALRSNFTKNVVVPFLVPTIGFAGVVYSIWKTTQMKQNQMESDNQRTSDENTLRQNLLLGEMRAKSRQKWIIDVRNEYGKLVYYLYLIINQSKESDVDNEMIANISMHKVRLCLMLNPRDEFDLLIEKLIDEILGVLNSKDDRDVKKHKLHNLRILIDIALSEYLKNEWDKYKMELEGELSYSISETRVETVGKLKKTLNATLDDCKRVNEEIKDEKNNEYRILKKFEEKIREIVNELE